MEGTLSPMEAEVCIRLSLSEIGTVMLVNPERGIIID
jgi:hypothetical protein